MFMPPKDVLKPQVNPPDFVKVWRTNYVREGIPYALNTNFTIKKGDKIVITYEDQQSQFSSDWHRLFFSLSVFSPASTDASKSTQKM